MDDLSQQLLGRHMNEKERTKVHQWIGNYGVPAVKDAFGIALEYPEVLEHPLPFVKSVLDGGGKKPKGGARRGRYADEAEGW